MRSSFFWQILLMNIMLTGCTMGPRYEQPPEIDIPEEWHSDPAEGMHSGNLECFVWWESLNDPILNSLLKRASVQNFDLLIAGTRILVARVERLGKSADLYPHVDASMTTGHLYYSKDALIKGILGRALSSHQIGSVKRNVNFFEIGFDATWEIDFFGLTKHQINALQAKVESAEENLRDRWITLSAEVARNYIELRSLQQRLQILISNIDTQKDALHLIQELLSIGVSDNLDLLRAEAELNTLLAEKPLLEFSIDKAIHSLSILLGLPPGELFAELNQPATLPLLPCEKPLGLPSELLRRRPDIRRAERELAAATELVGSAVASLFPRISLMGFVGYISTQLHSLTSGASGTWFVAPQLLLPIFNSKLLTQDVNLSKIQTQQALFEYQKTVLEALEEVENDIASFRHEIERNASLNLAQKAMQEAQQLTLQLHQRGIKDYLEVQIATRTLLAAEDAVIQSQTQLLLQYIALYKALGGGWNFPDWSTEEACLTDGE
jgi:NodT family efflux transporter outer membrane factor (OMF) lipoprotein